VFVEPLSALLSQVKKPATAWPAAHFRRSGTFPAFFKARKIWARTSYWRVRATVQRRSNSDEGSGSGRAYKVRRRVESRPSIRGGCNARTAAPSTSRCSTSTAAYGRWCLAPVPLD